MTWRNRAGLTGKAGLVDRTRNKCGRKQMLSENKFSSLVKASLVSVREDRHMLAIEDECWGTAENYARLS